MPAPATTHRTAGHGLQSPSRGPLRRSSSPRDSSVSLPPDRRGRLRNGAEPGDFLAAPRCGAHTRAGGCCRQPAMANGRCRLHGGLSTGPRTAEGRARCARARRIHGFYSAEMVALRRAATAHCRRMDAFFATVRVRRTAGHGLLPPNLSSRAGGEARISPAGAPAAAGSTSSASPRLRGGPPAGNRTATAGHGVLRSVSISRPSPRTAHLLAGTSLRTSFPARHGVLPPSRSPLRRAEEGPSFSPLGPVPAGMMVQPAPRFVAAADRW
jgi:hypothetical protein